MSNKHMATFSASIISSQMKATVRFYYKSNRMTNAKKTGNSIVLGVGGGRGTDTRIDHGTE